MTVASSQQKIPSKVYDFFHPENKTTQYAVLERNFKGIDTPKKREHLIDQLDLLDSDPRIAKRFLITDGVEDRKAMRLLDQMIRSKDIEVAKKANSIFLQYLDASLTKQNLMGDSIDPENANKEEKAFETVCKFLETDDSGKKEDLAKSLANSCGFLYREDGDDRQNTTWKRGKINEIGKAGKDTRLFDFYHKMQNTESGKVLHELLKDLGLQDMHTTLYSRHLSGEETGLSDQVRTSIDQQRTVKSPALNPTKIWGDKSFVKTIKPGPTEEVKFLEKFRKSADFEFSLSNLESSFLKKDKADRRTVILDFMAGFELLSFRKAQLIKSGRPSDDPILNRAAKKIEAQQKEMLKALKEHTGRDPELAQAVQDLFKEKGTSIFLYHMLGGIEAAEESVSNLVERETKEILKDYGPGSTRLKSGAPVTDSYKDLTKLKEETEEKIAEDAIKLANEALIEVGRPEILNHKSIGNFERWGSDISFSTEEVTDETKANAEDTEIWERTKKLQKGVDLKFFGLNAAAAEFKSQLNSSTDPELVYARNNFERIYGISIDDMLTKVIEKHKPNKTDTEDSLLIKDSVDFGREFAAIAKAARARNNHNPKEYEFGHAITTSKFHSEMKKIIQGDHSLAEEKVIAKIINDDTETHVKDGFGDEATGHLERLLLSPDLDEPGLQRAERILGVLELEKKILDSGISEEEKIATIEHLHHKLLGERSFTLTDVSSYQAQLNNALGTGARAYKNVISLDRPSKMSSLLKLRYKLDDLSIANGNISRTVMGFMRRETNLLIEGFEGNIPEGLFSSDENTLLETINTLRERIEAAVKADTVESENEALEEMCDLFEKIGFPVNELFPAGSIEDGSWDKHFMFSDPIFHSANSNGSDIIQVLIEIWNNLLKRLNN